MRTGLVTAKIQNGITVAWNCLPAILIQFFDLRHVLNDNACRDGTRAHGCKLAGEAWQRHGGKLVQHEANVARQRAVMNLVCAVIQGLECLRVKQAYKEIKRVVVVGNDSVKRDLFFAQRVKVHIVVVGQGLNLRQIERCKADSRTHQDRFCGLARG